VGAAFALAVVASVAAVIGIGCSSRAVAPAQLDLAPVRPVAPSRYLIPRPFVRVRTAEALRSALARRTPTTIMLQAGTYDSDRAFVNVQGHELYAARVGDVVLRAGLRMGTHGRGGGLVRGVVFDVRTHVKSVDGVVLFVDGAGAQVLDVTLRGHGSIRSGLVVREPEGFRAARVVVRDFTDYGVLVDANDRRRTSLARPFRLRDVDVSSIRRPRPGSSRGRAEASHWVGNPGIVERARVRLCGWTGLWTGTAVTGARLSRIDVDRTRTGVYLEHRTRRSTFERLRVGPRVRVGLTAEWADPSSGGVPASVDNVIRHSRFESRLVGVYLDEGTTRTTIRTSAFVGQRWAAIGDYKGVDNAYQGNDYSRIAPGAVPVSHDHIATAREADR
jgi:hypothetical protein